MASDPAINSLFQRVILTVALLLLQPTLGAQDAVEIPVPQPPDAYDQLQSFSFALVRVPVWVIDNRDRPVANLDKSRFKMLVDGRRAAIDNCYQVFDRPMQIVFMLDLSGSMAIGDKLARSVEAVDHIIDKLYPDDRWHVIVFSDGQIVEAANHHDPDSWQRVKPKLSAYGKTALFDALSIVDRYFDQESNDPKAVLLFTDGSDNQSELNREQLLKVLKILHVPVFAVSIGEGFDTDFYNTKSDVAVKDNLQTMLEITKITGGRHFFAQDSSRLPHIAKTLHEDLRPQYVLTITVERGSHDSRRALQVKVKGLNRYQVRHRTGYFGSLPEFIGGK